MESSSPFTLRKIQVLNFGPLRDPGPLELPASGLRVLIGPNASGKTWTLRTLQLASALVRLPLRGPKGRLIDSLLSPGAEFRSLIWRGESERPIDMVLDLESPAGKRWCEWRVRLGLVEGLECVTQESLTDVATTIDNSKDAVVWPTERRGEINWAAARPRHATLPFLAYPYREDPVALPTIRPFIDVNHALAPLRRCRPIPSEIAATIPRNYEFRFPRETGYALALALQEMRSAPDAGPFDRLTEALRKVHPHILGIGTPQTRDGTMINFRTSRSKSPVPAAAESDGVLVTLYLLWLAEAAGRGELGPALCIEEPEASCHPHLIRERVELLRDLALGKCSGIAPRPVLVTTQSIEFARWCNPEEIIVVEFSEQDGTRLFPLQEANDLKQVLDTFGGDLGDAWYSGAIGGTPSRIQ